MLRPVITCALGSDAYQAAWQLRRRVLLDPFGIDHTLAQVDDHQATHLALFEGAQCVACLMLVPRDKGLVQMRQVAVLPELQRTGLGRALVIESEVVALGHDFARMKAHARNSALPFYVALGYNKVGEPFEEAGLMHQEVEKALS